MYKVILILFFGILFSTLYAEEKHHDEHEEHHSEEENEHQHIGAKAIGIGKAIIEVNEQGFKLSTEAIKTLKLNFITVNDDTFIINKATLVASNNLRGIYRYRSGFFKLVPILILEELTNGYRAHAEGIQTGDKIVTSGVGLLRVSDVYSTDKAEYGHSH